MGKRSKRTNPYAFFACAVIFITLGCFTGAGMLKPGMQILYKYAIAINVSTFLICWFDKAIAGSGSMRVPEKILFGSAAVGGSLGLLLGMRIFHHKTRSTGFQITFILILAFQAILLFEFAPMVQSAFHAL